MPLVLLAACGGSGSASDAGSDATTGPQGYELDDSFGVAGTATIDLERMGAYVIHARAIDLGDRIEIIVPLDTPGEGALCTLDSSGRSMGSCTSLVGGPLRFAVRSGNGVLIPLLASQIVRYENGAQDPTFGSGGSVTLPLGAGLQGMVGRADGSVDLLINQEVTGPTDLVPRIQRMDGAGVLGSMTDVAIRGGVSCGGLTDTDGIVIGGYDQDGIGFAARFDSNLAPDSSFGSSGVSKLDRNVVHCAAIEDGRTVVSVDQCPVGNCGVRVLDQTGAFDNSVGQSARVGGEIVPWVLRNGPNGTWFIGGDVSGEMAKVAGFDSSLTSIGPMQLPARTTSFVVGVDVAQNGDVLVVVHQNVLSTEPARLYVSRFKPISQ